MASRYRRGRRTPTVTDCPLKLRHHRAALRLGGADQLPDRIRDLVCFALDRILRCVRSSAQLSVLFAGMETSTSAVLLFDRGGDIVYANPSADSLLFRHADGGLGAESNGERPPTVLTRMRSTVTAFLDGQSSRRACNSLLVLSDGSVVGCEIVRIGGADGVSGVVAAALMQPLTTLPVLFLEAFCARHGVSRREQEVLRLLLEGCGTAELASRLAISEYTVRDHLKRLYRKTGTRSRSELLSMVSTARMEPAGGRSRG